MISDPVRELLNDRQLVDYKHEREELIRWMTHVGKDPERAEGYAHQVVKRRANDIDRFHRYVWREHADGYTTAVTHDHADAYTRELAYSDYSASHKANTQKSLKMLYRYQNNEWEPKITFNGPRDSSQPREYLTRDERRAIREAALEWGSVPAYGSLAPNDRSRWKRYLAERYGKPINDVSPADFERSNGFKYTSLVWVSLDAGLRPIEVNRAKVGWCDLDNALLRIPAEEASKNSENWTVSLRSRTAEMLRQWLHERPLYDKYEDSDHIWLTRHGNPYRSGSLQYVLDKLASIAGIDTEERQLSWYAIRHSVGTYMAREGGIAAAQTQLRHRSSRTTMKYDQTPTEDRRDALDRMG